MTETIYHPADVDRDAARLDPGDELPTWVAVYYAAMHGDLDPDEAFLELMAVSDVLHAQGDHRQARHVSNCAARIYEDKIPGGIDGAVAAARADNYRQRCRAIVRRGHRRARSSHRHVGSRLAAKATAAADPDPEPPRPRRPELGGASW